MPPRRQSPDLYVFEHVQALQGLLDEGCLPLVRLIMAILPSWQLYLIINADDLIIGVNKQRHHDLKMPVKQSGLITPNSSLYKLSKFIFQYF